MTRKKAKINSTTGGRKVFVNAPGRPATVTTNYTEAETPTLDAPSSLNAADASGTQINVSWSAVTDATNYILEQSLDGSTGWTQIYSGSSTSYNNTGLTVETTYYYRVKAQGAGYNDSTYSSIASDTTPPADADAPVIYRMTSSTDGTKINIWFDRDMADPSGKHGQFSWKQDGVGRTFSAAALVGTKIIQLTTSHTILEGEELLITYAPGTVQSDLSESLLAMQNAPVLNSVTSSDVPFFDYWDMCIDARDSSLMTLSGTNITRLFDACATGRFFDVQGTQYAVYDSADDAIDITNGSTNEYLFEREIRLPASGRFSFVLKYKTPAAGDASRTNTIYFLRHASNAGLAISTYNATPQRRNLTFKTTLAYFNSATTESNIQNDDSWHYVVVTYSGSDYKVWTDGVLTDKTPTLSSVESFNRLFQAPNSRATHAIRLEMIGEYLSDSDVATLNTFLASA